MVVVGLTGGIGSGKTTVARAFEALGVPVYIADAEAKQLMRSSKVIKRKLNALFGEEAYLNGELNRPFIASIIFKNKVYLDKMNAIIHPRVAKHFQKWAIKQKADYVIKEVAILFENGGDVHCDFVITVTAPKEERIKRVLKRDNTTTAKIEAIMSNQLSDKEKMDRSHYVIENISYSETRKQVAKIHKSILSKIA